MSKAKAGHHYYASTPFAWAVGPDRASAVKAALEFTGRETAKRGVSVYSVRVELPQDATYDIEYYTPKDVPLSDREQKTYALKRGKLIPFEADQE